MSEASAPGEARGRGAGEGRHRADERDGEIDGLPLHWHEVAPREGRPPVLYVHGVPTGGSDFLPFLEQTGGLAPDLPGFGRSGKPATFDYSIAGYARFLEAFLSELQVDRFSLVVHDWGSVGLALAHRAPARLERLVVINAVPLLAGYRWHALARIWRTPLAGELAMGFSTRWALERFSRRAVRSTRRERAELVDRVWRDFDHGTQRAILKLYRSAPPDALAAAGRGLGRIDCPALVVWGVEDPYIPASFAGLYADALGGQAKVELVPGAGHWPWIDRPDTVGAVVRFLLAEPA